MKLRTELKLDKSLFSITYQDRILSLGSCFADTIGRYLQNHKFDTLVNPTGILFSPQAICNVVEWAMSPFVFDDNLVVKKDGMYVYFLFHSDIKASSVAGLRDLSQSIHSRLRGFLESADALMLTLGTAFVYEHQETGIVVTSCHKIPQGEFCKRMMSTEEVKDCLNKISDLLPHIKKKIITVSPVRHIKDTLVLNSLSKSILRVACSESDGFLYFPAYELLMDDLRDYRFYADDMLHPSDKAKKYIVEKFLATYMGLDTLKVIERVEDILRAVAHKPFTVDSESHQFFLRTILTKMEKIPVSLGEEKAFLEAQLM